MIEIYTDGAFSWARRPAFGFVAIQDGSRQIGEGCGQVANDGSNNFAGEVAGVVCGLLFALQNGHTAVRVHTDFATMGRHVAGRTCSRRTWAANLRKFLGRHPELQVEVRTVSGTNPLLRKAHHLARAAVVDGEEFVVPEAA
jgi:ribonuclease HI